MVSSTKVEDFPSYKLNRFARKLIVNFCERDKKYVSSFKCRDTCSAVQVNRLNEWVERGGKCHRISYPESYKNSSSVIFTDFIRSDLLIFTKKKILIFRISIIQWITRQANLAFRFETSFRIKSETSLKTNESDEYITWQVLKKMFPKWRA